jgi:CHAT domain-containing protein/tetratricopeptide (TPR) repeat protein
MMDTLELEAIKSKIQSFRSSGKFIGGANLVRSLPPDVKNATSIIIEIAQLYLVQGQLRSAADTCENALKGRHLEHRIDVSDQDSEVAAFKLMHAYINILRYSKLKTALKVVQLVGKTWNINNEDHESEVKSTAERSESSQSDQRAQVDREMPTNPHTPLTPEVLNEYRVLLEFYYWKTLVVSAEQGLLDEKQTKAAAAIRIGDLRKAMQRAGRFREARYLIFFEAGIMTNNDDAIKELEAFIELLSDAKWDIERATSLVDLGERQMKSTDLAVVTAAEESFRRASELFTTIGHGFGHIDIDHARLSGSKSISSGERLAGEQRIAQLYFEAGHLMSGIRCLALAISPDMVLDLYGERVVQAVDQLNSKIEESGSEILRQISLIHSVSQAILKAPEYGFALRGIESYYSNLPEEIGPKNHALLALALAQIYSNFGEHRRGVEAAEEALEVAKTGKAYDIISDTVFQVGHRRIQLAESGTIISQEADKLIDNALDLLKEWADKDAEEGYVDGEVIKCIIIASCENFRAAKRFQASNVITGPVEQPWIDRIKRHIPDSSPALERSQVVALEVRVLMRQSRHEESMEISNKYLSDLDQIANANPFAKAQASLQSAIQSTLNARSVLQGEQPLSANVARSTIQLLWTSLKVTMNALELYRQTNGAEMVLDCTTFAWNLLSQVVVTLDDAGAKDLLGAFLSELLKTEELCDQMRRSVVPVSGLKDLMTKRQLVARKTSLELYRIGVEVSLRVDDAASAWNWLQKGKARAFADSVGANLLIPQAVLDKVSSDQTSFDLLKQEQHALEAVREPGVDYVMAARRLASIRAQMEQVPLLAEVKGFKDGTTSLNLDAEHLKLALERTDLSSTQVKFVDWVIPASGSSANIVQLVHLLDGSTTKRELPLTHEAVRTWVDKAFKYPHLADPPLSRKTGNRFLQQISPLLEGLSHTTSPNDLIVLSPSGILNSLPLHALSVDGQPLIERNLVVYSPNAAVFQQCLSRVNTASHSAAQDADSHLRNFFAVYEEPDDEYERERIFDNVTNLASKFGGNQHLGPAVTKADFLKQCSSAKWNHFHGHANYSLENVLESSLILSNGRDIFQERIDDPAVGRVELSVTELFGTKLQDGTHFTIIACDSGSQDIAPGDEPLGIISALVHAGATSVLGCQWPIDSRAGRAMSEAFYDELNETRGGSGSENSTLYLARSLQIVIGKMRKGELGEAFKQPYYWAPFALHGLWFHVDT